MDGEVSIPGMLGSDSPTAQVAPLVPLATPPMVLSHPEPQRLPLHEPRNSASSDNAAPAAVAYVPRSVAEEYLQRSQKQAEAVKAHSDRALARLKQQNSEMLNKTVQYYVDTIKGMKEAAQQKVWELEQRLADALATVTATRAEAEAALSAEVNAKEQAVHNAKLESVAKEMELQKILAETEATLTSHTQDLVKSKAECDALTRTLETHKLDSDAKISRLAQQLTDVNEALVATTVLDPSVSGAGFVTRLPAKGHDMCKQELVRLQKCLDSRDEAVAMLEYERDKAMKSLAKELSTISQRLKQRNPPHDVTTTAVASVAPVPSPAPEIKSLHAEIARLQSVVASLESKDQTPVRLARPSHVVADVSTPVSAVLSPDAASMLLSPTDANTSLSDTSSSGVRLAEVVLQEIKLSDAKADLGESNKSLSTVKHRIRAWMNDFEAREGRKAEKTDKKAIRDDFVQLRELEQKVQESETSVSDASALLEKMRSQYQLREPELPRSLTKALLCFYIGECKSAITIAKQLWTDKKKRVCLAMLQRLISLILGVLSSYSEDAGVSGLEECLKRAVSTSDVTLQSKPVQSAVALRKGLDAFVDAAEHLLATLPPPAPKSMFSRDADDNLLLRHLSPPKARSPTKVLPAGRASPPASPKGQKGRKKSPRVSPKAGRGRRDSEIPLEILETNVRSALDAVRMSGFSDNREVSSLIANFEPLLNRLHELGSGAGGEADSKQLQTLKVQVASLQETLSSEQTLRKQYWNALEDGRGKVRVVIRIRPPTSGERSRNPCLALTGDDQYSISVGAGSSRKQGIVFNSVLQPSADQDAVYAAIRGSMQQFITGRDVSIVACGEAKSGKSYTMFGSSDAPGVVPRAIKDVMSSIAANGAKFRDVNLNLTMLDLCNETFVDLLGSSDRVLAIDTHINEKGTYSIMNASSIPIRSQSDVTKVIGKGLGARQPPPSYAHCIIIVTLEAVDASSERPIDCRAMFITLANFDSAEARSSDKYKDAIAAQRSWQSLQTVVSSLATGRSDVTWNATKLNQVLSSCFGTPTVTTVIANVSPCETSTDNSLDVVEFAVKARQVMNKCEPEDYSQELARLRRIVKNLQDGGAGVGFVAGGGVLSPVGQPGARLEALDRRAEAKLSHNRGQDKQVDVELEEFDED